MASQLVKSAFWLDDGASLLPREQQTRDLEFSRRLNNFAYARAAVFAGTGVVVLLVLTRNRTHFDFGYSTKFILGVVLVAFLSAAAQGWVSRARYQMRNIALLLLLLDQVLFSAVAYLTGGVSSGATSLLGVTCVAGGVLLGVPGAVASVVAGVIFFSLILLIVEGAQDLLPPDQPSVLFVLGTAQAVYYYVFTVLMLLLVGLLSSYLAERLARAGGEIIEARVRAERAERMAVLGRLAAGLAHEIRNPLGAISGSVQMLCDSVEKVEDRELLDIVARESARLNDLVSDMLVLSKTREERLAKVDLSFLVADITQLSKRSGRGAADVLVTLDAQAAAMVQVDAARIKQMAWNLVRNAIQASVVGGQVRVRVQKEPTVQLIVEDDGVGIDSEAQKHLFEEFYTTRAHGTGLGLAVVKRIADEHGIALEVRSERARGAIFIADFGPALSDIEG